MCSLVLSKKMKNDRSRMNHGALTIGYSVVALVARGQVLGGPGASRGIGQLFPVTPYKSL